MRRTAGALAVLALCCACSGADDETAGTEPSATTSTSPTLTSFELYGSISVAGGSSATGSEGETCVSSKGYDDVQAGTQVVVADGSGTTLGLGDLMPGTLKGAGSSRRCVFTFAVFAVPKGEQFYAVTVGDRGTEQYTEAQARGGVELTLG